jgi:nucleoside-diphosphate-sugar epimerase
MKQKVALVVGDTGLVGTSLVAHLADLKDWRVLGVSRGAAQSDSKFEHISLDLTDPEHCRQALAAYPDITHVFWTARLKGTTFDTPDSQSNTQRMNVEILANLMDALEPLAGDLAHVHLVQGTKWYGSGLGPIHSNIPAREDDPRQMPPNPYYGQHDYLVRRQEGKSWTWSAIRPSAILGFAPGYPNNLVALVGAYAAICRELGIPLRFPGTPQCYKLPLSAVDVEILSKAIVWIAEHEECGNRAFNVSNGDAFNWERLWPEIARNFGLESGGVQPIPFSRYMGETGDTWAAIVKKHELQDVPASYLADWEYGDYHFNKTRGEIPSIINLWRTGFHEVTDTITLFLRVLDQYRAARLLP